MATKESFTIEIVRGDVVESAHPIHAVVADRSGTLMAWGEQLRPTIPRSAIKSIQALPLITTGAADAFDVSQEELALACASHSGEQAHVDAVLAWLDRIGLSENDLECGADKPLGVARRREFYAERESERPVFNCCSGKHAGFLSVTRHLGHPADGYIDRTSAVQRLVTDTISTMTGLDLSSMSSGIDGCGIPVFALPLERLAYAMARMVDPVDLPADTADAASRVAEAARLAFWVSGSGRTEVKVTERADEPVVIKTGAEGVFMAALPDRGLGIALKSEDGQPRASQAAIKALLHHLDVLSAEDADQPDPIHNKAGAVSGEVRAVVSVPKTAALAR